jgi:8-oxo-dGTP pyrophosphatase MutT (NUDIX family)
MSVNDPSKWGLPGGSLEAAERAISRDRTVDSDYQWYARRRAVIREAIEEAGDSCQGPSFDITLPELWHADQYSPAVDATTCLPKGMALALDDSQGILIRGITPSPPGTFYFVYLISKTIDGAFFCAHSANPWQPRAQPYCRWENDEAFRGGGCRLGYCWAPLPAVLAAAAAGRPPVRGAAGRLCSWVEAALADAAFAAAVERELALLALLRDPPPPPLPLRLLPPGTPVGAAAGTACAEPRPRPS